MSQCPLCLGNPLVEFAMVGARRYLHCAACDVVVLDRSQLPTAMEERAEYELHENDPADRRYRRHLARLTDPLVEPLRAGARGLDFGCGPGPAVAAMLSERGYVVRDYDPFFRPDRGVLEARYDFIACTEAAEHFHHPAREFGLFRRLLRPGGRLGIMTRLRTRDVDFHEWWYVREHSHVTFYSPATMRSVAPRFGWAVEILSDSVVIFTAP